MPLRMFLALRKKDDNDSTGSPAGRCKTITRAANNIRVLYGFNSITGPINIAAAVVGAVLYFELTCCIFSRSRQVKGERRPHYVTRAGCSMICGPS